MVLLLIIPWNWYCNNVRCSDTGFQEGVVPSTGDHDIGGRMHYWEVRRIGIDDYHTVAAFLIELLEFQTRSGAGNDVEICFREQTRQFPTPLNQLLTRLSTTGGTYDPAVSRRNPSCTPCSLQLRLRRLINGVSSIGNLARQNGIETIFLDSIDHARIRHN